MRAALIFMTAALLAVAAPGSGETIKKKARKENQRINKGVRNGSLTPKETERLRNQQEDINRERSEAMEDGHMSKREKADIKHDQKRLSHDIYNKKHNAKHTTQ